MAEQDDEQHLRFRELSRTLPKPMAKGCDLLWLLIWQHVPPEQALSAREHLLRLMSVVRETRELASDLAAQLLRISETGWPPREDYGTNLGAGSAEPMLDHQTPGDDGPENQPEGQNHPAAR